MIPGISKVDDLIQKISGLEPNKVADVAPVGGEAIEPGVKAKDLATKIEGYAEAETDVFESAEEKEAMTGTPVPFALEEAKPVSQLEPSKNIFAFIKEEEGMRLQAYDDATGKTLTREQLINGDYEGFPTIGFGHKLSEEEIKSGIATITQDQADKMFAEDIDEARVALQEEYKDAPPVNQQEYDAHLSLIYNTGSFKKFPKLRKAIKEGDRKGMADEMLDIVSSGGRKLRGLELRRQKEVDIFKEARYTNSSDTNPDVVVGLQTKLPAGEYEAEGKIVVVAANGTVESITNGET